MTSEQLTHAQSEFIRAAVEAEMAVRTCKMRLAVIGQYLEALGRAFQDHPEEIRSVPEAHSVFDYRKAIEILREGEKHLKMCDEFRSLTQQAQMAKQRQAMFTSGPFFSSDSNG